MDLGLSDDQEQLVGAFSMACERAVGPDRVRELVRMLSGLEDSQSGAEHATELLELAFADKAQTTARRPAARRGGTARAKR